jgi:hypothetical protein
MENTAPGGININVDVDAAVRVFSQRKSASYGVTQELHGVLGREPMKSLRDRVSGSNKRHTQ